MSRRSVNRLIVAELREIVEAHPDLRFGQILNVFGFVDSLPEGRWRDEFYLESSELLKRIRERKDNV